MENASPKNVIMDLSFAFAIDIIEYCTQLEERRKWVIANQLFKSGTSIGANVRESQNPESRADFIHKIKVAAKEADETHYWLELCQVSRGYPEIGNLMERLEDIIRILNRIIFTAKSNAKQV
jgi:four helix bundle protein